MNRGTVQQGRLFEYRNYARLTTRARELVFADAQCTPSIRGNGCFVIETEDELQEYIDSLESRMRSIADRKYGVRRAEQDRDGEIESSEDANLL